MLKLYDKTFSTLYGTLSTVTEALVEEERNGLFELSFIMLNTDSLFKYIEKENIVVCNANDTLINQKFRIYMTRKLMNNRVEVFARHISFDLMYDYIDNLSFTNQSCQYVLNQLFRSSNFSTNYKGYSDIVNAQDYSISNANILEAIGGKEGSILDTFGNGAEILRDNENIHILSRRGYDNSVTIEYRKNLTGFELEEDTTDLVTRILPYAKYTPEGGEETIVKGPYVDSPYINNYSHPYIKAIDYSDKFEDGETPTTEKLIALTQLEYKDNKVDIPKQNFKIEFIPLSKCVGYEGLNDRISLCDITTIIDTRYNVNTQAKVIRYVFDVIRNRYKSMELGEPKTTLGDIIGNGNSEPIVGPPGPQGPPGKDGNLGDFPNSLPQVPMLQSFVYGFANIELTWSFENKVYYSYELYASKTKDFIPNTFDLIFQGQASSYLFQAKANEIWYFKVCAINTYGERTAFSNQVAVTTTKISDLSNYVSEMAIDDALIGKLRLDRGWIGRLNANYLDVKGNFSVTDGNGKRTFDIDSFGNVSLDVSSIKLKSQGLVTENIFQTTMDGFKFNFQNNTKNNMIKNGKFKAGTLYYTKTHANDELGTSTNMLALRIKEPNRWGAVQTELVECEEETLYTAYIKQANEFIPTPNTNYTMQVILKVIFINSSDLVISSTNLTIREWEIGFSANDISNTTFTTPKGCTKLKLEYAGTYSNVPQDCDLRIYCNGLCITKGENQGYFPSTDEIYSENVKIDTNGITITHKSGAYSIFDSEGSNFYSKDGTDMTSLRNGGIIGYHAPTTEMIGHIFPTNKQSGDIIMNGWSISNSLQGDYISISKANNNEESGFTLEDIIICYTNDVEHLGGRAKGTYFDTLDVTHNTRTFFKNYAYFDKPVLLPSRDYEYFNEICVDENNNNDLKIHACDSLTLGIRHDYTKYHALTLIKDPNRQSKCYGRYECDYDLNGYMIYNGYFSGTFWSSYDIPSGQNIDVNNDIAVLIACEEISTVNKDGKVEYDVNDMIKLLYKKIHDLENEIEALKENQIQN